MTSLSAVYVGILASLIAGLGTIVGALPIVLKRQWSAASQRLMLSVAGGIMLGATVFSLILPALEVAGARSGHLLHGAAMVAGGILAGAFAIALLYMLVPAEHDGEPSETAAVAPSRGRWLFVLAVALHNFPEGLTVGVAAGTGNLQAGAAVTAAIGLQNMPEGLAVAAALVEAGVAPVRAFRIAALTGLVEPLGGVLGALAVNASAAFVPWGLAIAAGAMLFVICSEIIPETCGRRPRDGRMALAVVAGVVAMMALSVAIG